MRNYVNAAPHNYPLGTSDRSGRVLNDGDNPIAQFIPKLYTFAQRGDEVEQLVDRLSAISVFGDKTFDLRSPYATHTTVFANAHFLRRGVAMVKRLIPDDAKTLKSNLTLWIEIMPATIDDYQRNSIGHIVYDLVTGNPVVTGTVAGYKVKFVVTSASTPLEFSQIGMRTPVVGDMGATSMRYPIMDMVYRNYGKDGDDVGFRLMPYGGTRNDTATSLMKNERAYPLRMAFIRRTDPIRSPSPYYNLMGDLEYSFSVKPDAVDPLTDLSVYLSEAYERNYIDLETPLQPKQYGLFDNFSLYDDNIETVLGLLHGVEAPQIQPYHDFTSSVDDIYLLNFVTATNVNGAPYRAIQFVDDATSIRLGINTNVFMRNGLDGTLDDDTFNTLVQNELLRYGDINDSIMDMVVNVESTFVDTGFNMATKMLVPTFIHQRPDTNFILSTHIHGAGPLTKTQESDIAGALHARAALAPESDYFGTPALRGAIVGGSIRVTDKKWRHRVAMSIDFALKATVCMGASTGRWDAGSMLDVYPFNRVTFGFDISIPYLPLAAKHKLWDVGLIWAIPDDRDSYIYPHAKTVYTDDTSVLTSFINMFCVCDLNKVANMAWRRTTGNASLTDDALLEHVNRLVNEKVAYRYGGRVVIIPEAQYTRRDILRGYSWILPIKVYMNNMKTVQASYIEVFRMSDLEA